MLGAGFRCLVAVSVTRTKNCDNSGAVLDKSGFVYDNFKDVKTFVKSVIQNRYHMGK